jgi:hypothetical protein
MLPNVAPAVPVLNPSEYAPLTVELKLIAEFVVANAVFAFNVTGPV